MNAFARARPLFLAVRLLPPNVVVFVRAARPTHNHRHVGVMDDVGADAAEHRPPDFAESARADDDHVGVTFLRHLNDSFARLAIADDVSTGDLHTRDNDEHNDSKMSRDFGLTSDPCKKYIGNGSVRVTRQRRH